MRRVYEPILADHFARNRQAAFVCGPRQVGKTTLLENEKYDVEIASHKVFAEYGNVGTEFDYIAKEGFGWVNASYQYGLQILNAELKEKLGELISPDDIF